MKRILIFFSFIFAINISHAAAIAPESGKWWNPQNPNISYSIEAQDNTLSIVTFTYDDQGNPEWYSGFGQVAADGSTAIDLFKSEGGSCIGCSYVTPTQSDSGTEILLSFTDSGHGNLSIDDQLITIERFNFSQKSSEERILGNWVVSAPFVGRKDGSTGYSDIVSFSENNGVITGEGIFNQLGSLSQLDENGTFLSIVPISTDKNLATLFTLNDINTFVGKTSILDPSLTQQEIIDILNSQGTQTLGIRDNTATDFRLSDISIAFNNLENLTLLPVSTNQNSVSTQFGSSTIQSVSTTQPADSAAINATLANKFSQLQLAASNTAALFGSALNTSPNTLALSGSPNTTLVWHGTAPLTAPPAPSTTEPPPPSTTTASPPASTPTTTATTGCSSFPGFKSTGNLPQPYLCSNGLATFGQIFNRGIVPQGKIITTQYDTQVDVKARWDDGSLKHAVITIDGQQGFINFSVINPPTNQEAANYSDPGTTLTLTSGQNYSSQAMPLKTTWLNGPLVVEEILEDHNDPNLVVQFHVRHYNNGATRTEAVVENSKAYAPQHTVAYSAQITSGSATFNTGQLTHYKAQRWHHTLWYNNQELDNYVVQDTPYMTQVGVIDKYQANIQPSQSYLSKMRQSCAPLDNCEDTTQMGAAGLSKMIGPLPLWTTSYITYPQDKRTFTYMLAGDDGMGAYDIHFRENNQNGTLSNMALNYYPLSIVEHPGVSLVAWSYSSPQDKLPCDPSICTDRSYGNGNNNLSWDNSHQPSTAFIPYMVTGDYYWMEELAFVVSNNLIWPHPVYRQGSEGYIDSSVSQVRGKAWVLREIAHGAYLLPNESATAYPTTNEINTILNNNIYFLNTDYANNQPPNNKNCIAVPGITQSTDCANNIGQSASATSTPGIVNGVPNTSTSPWMHSYYMWAVQHIYMLGYTNIQPFAQFMAQFELGIFGPYSQTGYCWIAASAYRLSVKDANLNWLTSIQDIFNVSFPDAVGQPCPSTEMSQGLVKDWGIFSTKVANSGSGPITLSYPTQMMSSHGVAGDFPDYMQIGLAAAIDSGSSESISYGSTGWTNYKSEYFNTAREKAHNDWPVWAVIPRSLNVTE
ncbi:hypothetical protein [Candidatus Nitrosacidococcus tergens]|uniref:Uncharacterized protein n=1 Tax=Candidatus Nitrosacidococcus tergens TaxID=553981 RepID=A0A7G1QBH2_9GAMM|nr:hypothetical protein [Candidatus Nitrosacidococcus tergens]CAB1277419.1 exported protein of unknown function [Candidatus Nitrosacidococcus tergens]